MNPNMEFIGTRQKSRVWQVKVGAVSIRIGAYRTCARLLLQGLCGIQIGFRGV